MDTDRLLTQLTVDGPLLRDAASRAGWDTDIPGIEWNVRQLVVHTGAVHRWSADIVARALATNETGGSKAFHPDLDDGELASWFDAGHGTLIETLDRAAPDLQTFTFTRGVPARQFWIRRQAHETAIHRVDAELAAGEVTAFDPDFAQDGIDELAGGFARARAFAPGMPGTLALSASDGPSWVIDFGGERIDAVRSDDRADATVAGTSGELYRWLWNRPSPVEVTGDDRVVALWRHDHLSTDQTVGQRRKFWYDRLGVGPRCPWYREP